MINEVLAEARQGMDKAIEALNKDFSTMRTGRASTSIVDRLPVEYYGASAALQELALISIPEPQLIAIKPYDPTAMKAIERAILQSDLGLTPNNDGKIIRLQIPSLTEERRRELSKAASKRVEVAKVSVRNTRRDSLEDLRSLQKEKMITEDEFFEGRDELQKVTDEYIKKVDEVGAAKEKEILEI